ncbi:MAG: SUMF1/EgtB/PvdO family nonheme iron enzyme [Acidobacteria bacterium]|nr:SUMF1/EgtB/PvdO family nonheme iron enzyme [Acidobacteriota bacterium]
MIRAGEKIGPYTLISKLGRGTFGVVWLAEKRTSLAVTKVALKLPNDDGIDLEAVRREAAVWIEASGHPNVLSIIDADIYDEQVVIVSEFAPDGSLADWLKKHGGKAPTLESAVEMTAGILDGLMHLHARRIIHRDLKPANILLQGKNPRLADFGLARVLKTTGQSSNVSGTYAYMPPEAFDGKRSEQTDVWSAGVILYQMLTGRLPYPQTDDAALIGALLTREPEPPPDNLPPALREVLKYSLQKNPAERYPSVVVMREALRDVLHPSVPVPTAPPAAPELDSPTRKFPARTVEPVDAPPLTAPNLVWKTSEAERQESEPQFAPPQKTVAHVSVSEGSSPPFKSGVMKKRRGKVWLGVAAFLVTIGLAIAVSLGVFSSKTDSVSNPLGDTRATSSNDSRRQSVTNGIGMEFVYVPAGSFMMGSENGEAYEKPVHQVTIREGFYMGKYEVTQAQWQQVMGNNPSNFKGDNLPVETVSWDDAQEFIRKLNAQNDGYRYRLPSEAEWEYACRAGTTGDYAGEVDAMGWYAKNSGKKTHPVGQKQANSFGLYDLHGNVLEWCEDWYHDSYNGAPTDGSAWISGGDQQSRVLRGGSWLFDSPFLRSAVRESFDPGDSRYYVHGVRVVAVSRSS